jgi:hypothetical protein
MTNNNIFTKSKIKTFIVMILALIMSLSVLMVAACKKQDETPTTETKYNPSYSYTDYDDKDALISNANFKLGLADKANTDYPAKTTTGWTVSADNGSSSSQTVSGVIKTDDAIWDNVLLKLAEEDAFFDWAQDKFDVLNIKTKTTIKEAVKGEDAWKNKTDKEIDAEVETRFIAQFDNYIANPGVHTGADDNSIVMLSNFSSTTSVELKGVAQNIGSSSTINLEKGQSAKISFWVKTDANNEKGSANVRLSTTINGISQAQYAVTGIVTDGNWAQYTVYVKGNDYTYSTINLVLGFGITNNITSSTKDLAYGLCYYDDVKVEVFDTTEEYDTARASSSQTVSTMEAIAYTGNPEVKRIVATTGVNTYFYTLSYNDWAIANHGANDFYKGKTFGITGSYVDSQAVSEKFADSSVTVNSVDNAKGFDVDMVKSAYKFTIKDGANNFAVAKNSFASISFNLKTDFSGYNKSGVTFYVYDVNSKNETLKSAVLTVNEPNADGDDYVITIRNNYEETRYFYIEVVLGTATPSSQSSPAYFITGNVNLDNIKFASGYNKELLEDESKNPDFDKISFFKALEGTLASTNVSYALHAGKTGDFADSSLADTYNMEVSYANTALLKTKPVASTSYFGVIPDHEYVKVDGATTDVNTNVNAGVINTKYIDTYKTITAIADIDQQFGANGEYALDENDKALQPLMIYNASASSYGFIAKNTVKIEAANRALITLKVRVTGDATAYIYLVDMSNTDNKLNVINHEVKVNDTTTTNALAVKVNADTVAKYGVDGWVTVSFNVATGATAMTYRVELWNGSRDGQETSKGYVFFNNVSTSGTFTETTTTSINANGALLDAANTVINGNHLIDLDDVANAISFKRELTDKEIAYNEENPDSKITVNEKYVWLTNKDADGTTTFVYAIYNSIDPKITIPTAEEEVEDETTDAVVDEGKGCKAQGGTFWLQFANIALATLLIVLVLFIIVKHFRKNFKKQAKIKSHYNVSSRNKVLSETKKAEKIEKAVNKVNEEPIEEVAEEVTEEVNEEPVETTEESTEETEYTYGEVLEDFGDDVVIDGQEVELPKDDEVKPE